MAVRLTQDGQEVQDILNKSTVTGENIENVFGEGAGEQENLQAEEWLSRLKKYIDSANNSDVYLIDHLLVEGEDISDIFDDALNAKLIAMNGGSAFAWMNIESIQGVSVEYVMFGIKCYPSEKYCTQIEYKISGGGVGRVVTNVNESNILTKEVSDSTYLKISEATRDYLKKADANNMFVNKSGGTFTGDVYFSGGMTSRQGRFYDVVTHHANVNMDNHKIQNLLAPTLPGDAVNKQHIESNYYNKSEVDQKIQTETATYKGLFDKWSDVPYDSAGFPYEWEGVVPDNNDYIVIRDASLYATKWISGNADGYNVGDYVVEYSDVDNSYYGTYICIEYNAGSMDLPSVDSEHWQRVTENPNYKGTWRFKYAQSGEYAPFNFLPEYQINEEPLTPSQIAALDSGITAAKVTKLDALPTNSELQNTYMPKSGGTFTGDVNIGDDDNADLSVKGNIYVESGEIHMTDEPTDEMSAINKGYVDRELASKQNTLVSGTNIKTFAGQSLLSSGDVIQNVAIPAGNHLVMPNGSYVAIIKYGGVTMLFSPTAPSANILRLQGQPSGSAPYIDKATYDFGSQSFHFDTVGSSAGTASVMFISGTAVTASASNSSVSGVQSSPVVFQDKLVSGTNIKTINSTSLLGSGDIQISADTSDCVKFGEAIDASNNYLKIDGAGVPFSLMLVVTLDDYTSEYLVNASEQRVEIVKMNGEQSFDGMLRIDEDVYFPIALYHEDSLSVTPILLSGTMPTITDLASASGEDEEIPSFQTKKELPSGGTAGQVLAKASGTDYDVEWANGGGGGDGKTGVISQTQTWSGTGSNPRTYVMSNLVTGLIPQANIDLFEAAGATFNETTGYFELNGLTDISYEEMKKIYDASGAARSNFRSRESQFAYCQARTLLPIIQPYMTAFPTQITTMIYRSACESIGFYAIGNPGQPFNVSSQGLTNLANTCEKLTKFVGIIDISSVTNANSATTPFTNCYSLEDISLKGIKVSVAFGNSPNLSKASLLYMINNEASTSAITITLHASVYAKCQSGGEWYSDISTALAAHTNVSLASA